MMTTTTHPTKSTTRIPALSHHHRTPPVRADRAVRITDLDAKTDKPDLPFYAGVPTMISGRRWLVVVAACAVAFATLVALPLPGPPMVTDWAHSLLFAAIPLGALAWAAPTGWTAIVRRVRGRQVAQMFGFAALNIAVTVGVAIPVARLFGASANPMGSTLEHASAADRLLTLGAMVPQLVGEELITILPFLAVMYLLVTRLHVSRRTAILVGWVGTALMFGALHLPTYGWNVAQCLLVIGTARLVLTFAYLRTRNLAVSAGAHIINDWTLFTVPLLLAALTAAA